LRKRKKSTLHGREQDFSSSQIQFHDVLRHGRKIAITSL
jgi:hypothetical protein